MIRSPRLHLVHIAVAGIFTKRIGIIGADSFGNDVAVGIKNMADDRILITACRYRTVQF